jgi:hypothetical protein
MPVSSGAEGDCGIVPSSMSHVPATDSMIELKAGQWLPVRKLKPAFLFTIHVHVEEPRLLTHQEAQYLLHPSSPRLY